jgi:hypothetical protein
MSNDTSVEKGTFEPQINGSEDSVRHQSTDPNGPRDDSIVVDNLSTDSTATAYPLSNPRKYGLLALFASALAIDGE